jgi:hypothetical protein
MMSVIRGVSNSVGPSGLNEMSEILFHDPTVMAIYRGPAGVI